MLSSVAMASKGAPGSQVIVLTDGEANTGIGFFSNKNPAQNIASENFYTRVGQLAAESGVMVNLVTVEGCEAKIAGLQSLIGISGGRIEQVNPNEMSKDFSSILSQKSIAMQVEAKVKLHKGLQFRNELEADLNEDRTILTRRFGNVTNSTMFTFEYGMKPISELLEIEDLDMTSITDFPF